MINIDADIENADWPKRTNDRITPIRAAGGPGSGNFGHVGRPGEVGGSGDGGQTDTPAFKAWFKNSMVVDGQGNPQVMYHSTMEDFAAFQTDSEMGAHFGTRDQVEDVPGKVVMPVYLSIQNPVRLEDRGHFYAADAMVDLVKQGIFQLDEGTWTSNQRLQFELKARGYDGIVYLNRREGYGRKADTWADAELHKDWSDAQWKQAHPEGRDSWVVFDPEQVKSAIGNAGTFARKNPLITAGDVEGHPFHGNQWTGGMGGETKLSGLVERLHEKGGGFTYSIITQAQPTTGYVVATEKATEKVVDAAKVNGVLLARYVREHRDKLRQSGNYLGAWHDPESGKVYLDITTRVFSHAKADALARKGQQIAYFDLGRQREVRIDYGRRAAENFVDNRGVGGSGTDGGGFGSADEAVDGSVSDTGGHHRDAENSLRASGGEGSGNFGHSGRPGEVGGSGPGGLAPDGRGRSAVPSPASWSKPNLAVQADAQAYADAHGFGPIDHSKNLVVDPSAARAVAAAYDALPTDDSRNPDVIAAYTALGKETREQYVWATTHGMTFEPWTKDGQPYATSNEMTADVRDNHHLAFFTGGEPHPFLSQVDLTTGLTLNDEFRAIHDYYGHAAGGFGFGPRGEENAWAVHAQMFSEPARRAMTTETKGQNSWVNFGTQNYDEKGNYLNIPPPQRPYAIQKVALLPEKFLRTAQLRAAAPVIPGQPHSTVGPFDLAFDRSNPNAIAWAKDHAGELIKNISDTTRQAIADALARALDEGDLDQLDEDIEDAIGNSDRAELVAHTESMTAANAGLAESWDQAKEKGLLPDDTKKVWIATGDDITCEECSELDGEVVPMDNEFSSGDDMPPAHPRCRCTAGISDE